MLFCFALIPVGLHALLTTGYFSFVLSFFFIVYRGCTVSYRSVCFIKTIKLKLKQRTHAMKLTGLFMMGGDVVDNVVRKHMLPSIFSIWRTSPRVLI